VARIARELGILTVGIVTMPFSSEGKRKMEQARAGMLELKKHVDSLVVICNDKLEEMYGQLRISEAFGHADDVLATAAKGIAEIITVPGYINVDFEDVRTVMAGSGVAIMGSAMVAGEHRATKAISAALSSPLLNDNDIRGAKNILLNITSGTEEVLMSEITDIMNYLQDHAEGTDIIWGNCYDESIGENLSVTLIATGFETDQMTKKEEARQAEKVILPLEERKEPTPAKLETDLVVESDAIEAVGEKPNQITFNFDVTQTRKKVTPLLNEAKRKPVAPPKAPDTINEEERKRALRKMSLQLRNPNHLEEVEKTPAYKRNEVNLRDVPPSSETDMSDYSVHEDEDGSGTEVRKGNSFIHGAVD
jgi:cell division protein FtsZ